MITPSAMFIEAAKDSLQQLPKPTAGDQLKELHEAMGDQSADFQAGYQLGLETARVMLFENMALRLKGIDPTTLL